MVFFLGLLPSLKEFVVLPSNVEYNIFNILAPTFTSNITIASIFLLTVIFFSAFEKQCDGKFLLLFLIPFVACKYPCSLKTSACVVLNCHSHCKTCSFVKVP